MKALLLFAIGLGLFSLNSCSPTAPIEPEEPTQPRYIGQISSIHPEQGFVLIRRAPGVTVPSGTILISRGPGDRVANLRTSGESLGQMSAADIQSGTPEIGDSVHEPLIEKADKIPDEFNLDS